MPETFQLRLIWLLTLRCEGMTEKMSREELMYGLDCDEITLQKIHETFLQKGFIEKNWAVVNWDKRQYISDSSTPRVKKYRANKAMKQSETFQKQFHETHETQNETDQNRTEQNRTEKNLPPAVLRLPAVGGKEFPISQEQIDKWSELYQAVDVPQELRAMIGWLDSHTANRKTLTGMPKFINSWLSRSQNRAKPVLNGLLPAKVEWVDPETGKAIGAAQ